MPSFIDQPGDNVIDTTTPDRIRADALDAELAVSVARWLVGHWEIVPSLYRSAISYVAFDGEFGAGKTITVNVPLQPVLEILQVLLEQKASHLTG